MKVDPFPGTLGKEWIERPFVTRRGVSRYKRYMLTEEQKAWLRRWFPEVENNTLVRLSGINMSTLHRFASELGLTKSREGLRNIMRRQAAKGKEVMRKNGYYASLKGRRPSQACQDGVKRMWQEIHEGKREHPLQVMKRKHPRKYKKLMAEKAERRKTTMRMERRRVLFGMKRETNLINIVMNPYRKSQCSHRYNAVKRGYIIYNDCSEQGGERYNIYYDADTDRSPLFEENLRKDGFTLKPWKDQ